VNRAGTGRAQGIDRFVALTHSEGCGFGGETMYGTLHRTYRGYATHPNVAAALLLEHGCEKIPNDAMRREFERAGLPLERFGWASVQLDGGIEKAITNVQHWFETRSTAGTPAGAAGLGSLAVGLLSAAPPQPDAARALAALAMAILDAGGTVLVPEGDALLAAPVFRDTVLGGVTPRATLAYGQPFAESGLHLVATDSDHWVENVTGIAACGAHVVIGDVGDSPQQGHPLIPVLQFAGPAARGRIAEADVDLVLNESDAAAALRLRELVLAAAQQRYTPVAAAGGFVDFQLSRGLLGVST